MCRLLPRLQRYVALCRSFKVDFEVFSIKRQIFLLSNPDACAYLLYNFLRMRCAKKGSLNFAVQKKKRKATTIKSTKNVQRRVRRKKSNKTIKCALVFSVQGIRKKFLFNEVKHE